MLSLPYLSSPAAGKRAGPRVRRVEGLDLPIASCSTQESRHYTSPHTNQESEPCVLHGQNSRACPGDMRLGEPDPRAREQEKWSYSLLQAALAELAEAVLKSLSR